MTDHLTGRVFDIQRFTVNDGPGIRTEIFFKGCPLSCLWCHSPESQALEPQLAWFEIRCIGVQACGRCLAVCPQCALTQGPLLFSKTEQVELQVVSIDRQKCDNCGRCAQACPAKALDMAGVDKSVDELMAVIAKDKLFYRKSGGGVTLSGGEPMVQHEFITQLLRACKDQGLHTCLDTTGFARWAHYQKVLPYVDLVLLDLKQMDAEQSRRIVGVPNQLILDNARRMAADGHALQIRIPIIPGYTDSEKNLRAAAAFCAELGQAVTVVQILPYHRLGIVKYDRLQKEYQLSEVLPPDDGQMAGCQRLIESYGLKVQIH